MPLLTSTYIDKIEVSRDKTEERSFATSGIGTLVCAPLYDFLITSLAPEPYQLRLPILVKVLPTGNGYIASFYDANIYASGDTEGEALENLKSLIVEAYEMLSCVSLKDLGPEPAKQFFQLQRFIRPLSFFHHIGILLSSFTPSSRRFQMFDKSDAEAIANKLNATIVNKKKHDIAQFWHEGKLIAWYGIRRGSTRNLSHDYIPSQLKLSPRQCKEFRVCTMTLEQLVDIFRQKGFIPNNGQ